MDGWNKILQSKPEKYDTVEISYMKDNIEETCIGYMGGNNKWYNNGKEIDGTVVSWKETEMCQF